MNKYVTILSALTLAATASTAQTPVATADTVPAQEQQVIYITPLFEYPVAPDDMPDIESRSNYVMQHFWQPFDFKQSAVGQIALDHAFRVYITPIRWATAKVAEASIDALIKDLKDNPTLLLQFTKAAEHNLYSDQAEMWSDPVYLKFIDALLANKKIDNARKARYRMQRALLMASTPGTIMQPIEYATPEGAKQKTDFTAAPYTLIEFGDPFCNDCLHYKVKLTTSAIVKEMVDNGRLQIYFLIPDADGVEDWQRAMYTYPLNWKTGAASGLDMKYDLRAVPSVYLLDKDGRIIEKFISKDNIETLLQSLE